MRKIIFAALILRFLLSAHPAFALNDTIGVTAGTGKTANLIKFGSNNVISETGLCDATTENQCASVSAGGAVKVDASATTQPVSSTTLATAANQATEISSLSTIATNTGAAIPAGAAIIGKVGIDQTTPGTTNGIAIVGVNAATALAGSGATGTGSARVTTAIDQATNAGAALVKGGVGVVNGGSFYQHVAASQTGATLQSSTGATGDYLSHCVIYPSTTAAGSVTVFDSTNSAANNVIEFVTGTLSNLAPIALPVGAVSVNGAWKVTTGANETVVCYGKFS